MRITHVITGLETGGAESLLARIAPLQAASGLQVAVICLGREGPLSARLAASGIDVIHLNAGGLLSLPATFLKLRRLLKAQSPNVVHTWLYHADLLGGLAAKSLGIPVIWALHHAGVHRKDLKLTTYAIVRLLAKLSAHVPRTILSCSRAGLQSHQSIGYSEEKLTFLPNGTDTQHFCPRTDSRMGLGISADAAVIGIAARQHPLKDYPNFFAAAALLQKLRPDVHFLVCGQQMTPTDANCQEWLRGLPLPEKVHLLGPQSDLPAFYSALDVFTLASRSEAFPLTLGEAMACEIPCVATDVGDSAFLLGDTGTLCPASDSQALADAWLAMLQRTPEERHQLGKAARQRIVQQFSMQTMLDTLENHYQLAANPTLPWASAVSLD